MPTKFTDLPGYKPPRKKMSGRFQQLDITLTCPQEPTLDELLFVLGNELELKRSEPRNALRCILLNLLRTYDVPLIVSRRKGEYSARSMYNPSKIGYSAMISALDKLDSAGYIEQNIGGAYDLNERKGEQTWIVGTEKLYTMCWGKSLYSLVQDFVTHKQPIILRDSNKKKINYSETPYASALRLEMERYNKLLANTEIYADSDGGGEIQRPFAYRIFINNSRNPDGRMVGQLGGRMMGQWSHLRKIDRERLIIDGDKTEELDFKASSFNIVYKLATGHKWSSSDSTADPYALTIEGVSVPRRLTKKLMSILLNSKNRNAAHGSFRKECEADDEYKQLGITSRAILNAFFKRHPEVEESYQRDAEFGLKVQFIESELVFDIVKELTSREIPVLTIYDSFIVQKQHANLVRVLMDDALNNIEHHYDA